MIESRERATASIGSTLAGDHFLANLKAGTQARHTALENTRLTEGLMSTKLTRSQYAGILYGFYGAFQPLEQALAAVFGKVAPPLEPIHRSPLAVQDICSLLGQFDPSRLPASIALPWQLVDIPTILGVTYVLEGSRLGGKTISRQIQNTIGVTPENGGSFFAGIDSPGITGWKTFKNYCAYYASCHPDQQAQIIRVANETFQYVEDYFKAMYPKTAY